MKWTLEIHISHNFLTLTRPTNSLRKSVRRFTPHTRTCQLSQYGHIPLHLFVFTQAGLKWDGMLAKIYAAVWIANNEKITSLYSPLLYW